MKKRYGIWGPRFPGFETLLKTESIEELAAYQWKSCIDGVLDNRQMIASENFLEFKYEDLISNCETVFNKMSTFLGLTTPIVYSEVRSLTRSNVQFSGTNVDHILYKTMTELGYWT